MICEYNRLGGIWAIASHRRFRAYGIEPVPVSTKGFNRLSQRATWLPSNISVTCLSC